VRLLGAAAAAAAVRAETLHRQKIARTIAVLSPTAASTDYAAAGRKP